MLNEQTMEKLIAMKLNGMVDAFKEQLEQAIESLGEQLNNLVSGETEVTINDEKISLPAKTNDKSHPTDTKQLR